MGRSAQSEDVSEVVVSPPTTPQCFLLRWMKRSRSSQLGPPVVGGGEVDASLRTGARCCGVAGAFTKDGAGGRGREEAGGSTKTGPEAVGGEEAGGATKTESGALGGGEAGVFTKIGPASLCRGQEVVGQGALGGGEADCFTKARPGGCLWVSVVSSMPPESRGSRSQQARVRVESVDPQRRRLWERALDGRTREREMDCE